RRRHTSFSRDWSSDVCSSDLTTAYRLHRRKRIRLRAGEGKRLLTTVTQRVVGQDHLGQIHRFTLAPELQQRQKTAIEQEPLLDKIGRASCRERGESWGTAVSM